jgi:ERCC4-type nuclease
MNALVSSTDPELVKVLGDIAISSQVPEEYGADVLIFFTQGIFGMQRKAVPYDFISSMNDGRLTRETNLLFDKCKFKLILCEGRFYYYPDGTLKLNDAVKGHYNKKRIQGSLFNIKYVKGIDYDFTTDIEDTAEYIKNIIEFFSDPKHLGLYSRPSAPHDWIVPTARDIDLWMLQSFDGIGPQLAENIIQHFGGKIPIAWTCTLEELQQVPRLAKKAEEIYPILQQATGAVVATPHVETWEEKLQRLAAKK